MSILCLQETKLSDMSQLKLPHYVTAQWPHTYWSINPGTSQKKGLSGTAIFSKVEPVSVIPPPEFDQEGRITGVEFEKFIVISVYTPNSQRISTPRFVFRTEIWDTQFRQFASELNDRKPVILCGDYNVVERECDYHSFNTNKNNAPGLYDLERSNFALLKGAGPFVDSYTLLHPETVSFTYFSYFRKGRRVNPGDDHPPNRKPNGWVLDYILCSDSLRDHVVHAGRWTHQYGSDHVPIHISIVL